jgi:hypothetical protein
MFEFDARYVRIYLQYLLLKIALAPLDHVCQMFPRSLVLRQMITTKYHVFLLCYCNAQTSNSSIRFISLFYIKTAETTHDSILGTTSSQIWEDGNPDAVSFYHTKFSGDSSVNISIDLPVFVSNSLRVCC